jgi:hypothetical protein
MNLNKVMVRVGESKMTSRVFLLKLCAAVHVVSTDDTTSRLAAHLDGWIKCTEETSKACSYINIGAFRFGFRWIKM